METRDRGLAVTPPRLYAIVGGHTESPWLSAIAALGGCSGTLVTSDGILTSAHCLAGPIGRATINGHDMRLQECRLHPAFVPGQAAHDLGYCRLAERASVAPIPLDDGAPLTIGTAVSLAGRGSTGAFVRDGVRPRVVETSVVRVAAGTVDVGTDSATACRGDSGGPVVVYRAEGVRVAAIIQGASGAICASAARAATVADDRLWLQRELGTKGPWRLSSGVCIALTSALAALYVSRRHWRRAPRIALRAERPNH